MGEDRIGKAVLEISTDTKEVKSSIEAIGKQLEELNKKSEKIGEGVNMLVFKEWGEVAVKYIGMVVSEIVEMGKHGAAVKDVSDQFQGLSERTHSTADAMLGALRSGVLGTISDFDLMTMANKTMGSGLITSAEDMKTLSEGARLLAKRTGGETSEAFETLTSTMANGKTAHLKQLGIFVDGKVAAENYAASIGKTVGQLTESEKAHATTTAALSQLREELKRNVPDAADFGEMIDQVKTRVTNLRDQLSVAIAESPVIRAGMQAMGRAFEEAFGSDQQANIKAIAGFIEDVAVFLVDMARVAVFGGQQVINIWTLLKVAFNGYMFAVVGGLELVVKGIKLLVDTAAQAPGPLGRMYKSIQQGVTDAAHSLEGMRKSFGQQTGEALDGAGAQKAALDKVDGALVKMSAAMTAAKGATTEAAKAHREMGQASHEAAALQIEDARKIEAAERKLQQELATIGRVGIDQKLNQLKFEEAAELAGLKQLVGLKAEQLKKMEADVREKYRMMATAAKASSDEIRDKTVSLQQQITLATMTGQRKRLQEIEFERQKEMQSIASLKMRYGTEYAQIAALIKQKYDQMSAAARGHGLTVEQLAAHAGFKTREELQQTAAMAIQTYNAMRASGMFNADQLKEAHLKAEAAKREASGETKTYQLTASEAVLQGSMDLMNTFGAKFKAAAIAGAIINTYQGVAKAHAAAPPPFNLVLMAAALASGMANVAKIRSAHTGGFKEGTPGLDFVDFGSVSLQPLHGNEAVVPQGKGHLLAAEIARAMPRNGGDEETKGLLREIAMTLRQQPQALKSALRHAEMMKR